MKNLLRSAGVASLLFASVLGGIAMRSADAAPITWGSATTIVGDSDVITVGTLLGATSFGPNPPGNVTVNGVTFNEWTTSLSGNSEKTNGIFTLSADIYFQYDLFGSDTTPFDSLSTAYKDLLKTAIITQETGTNTVTISGLTSGQTYAIQFWSNDSRAALGSRTTTVGGVTLDVNTAPSNAGGGVGQWVSGTFTANATTQTFDVSSNVSQYYTAMQVRVVPEPSSLAGLGVIGIGLAAVIRRRLRAAKSAS